MSIKSTIRPVESIQSKNSVSYSPASISKILWPWGDGAGARCPNSVQALLKIIKLH